MKGSEKIPFREKLVYGAGDVFGGGNATIISVLLLNFLNVGLGIDAGIAGAVIMLSKLWDGISDPLMGVVSDNTRTRFGRRKPFIIIGGALTLFAFMWLFAPVSGVSPNPLKITIVVFAYLFYCTVSTISQVPYTSLASDISPDYRERNSANAVKLVFDMLSAGVCYIVPTLLYENTFSENPSLSPTAFWLIMTFGFGTLFAGSLILCGLKVKERCKPPAFRARFHPKAFIKPLLVKSYRYHLAMYVSAFLCMDIVSALALYYVQSTLVGTLIFGRPASSLFLIAPMMVCAGLWVPVAYKIMKKRGKQFAFRVGLPAYALGITMLCIYEPSWGSTWLIPFFAAVTGIGLGGAQMMPWLIFADTVDVGELKFGERDTGSFSGLMTFARKISTALAIFVAGLAISLSGFSDESAKAALPQPETATATIRVLMSVSVVVLTIIGFIASLRYKVSDKKLDRIRYFLEKAGRQEVFTDAEKSEKEELIKELG